jgi:energy-coupling factor transporter ATP-binding protein EcfA2
MTDFTDANIAALFGVSDAENESPTRLKEYFFRNKAYQNLANDLAIRILIGHKGSGKSALLKMLFIEDQEKNLPAIWLKPGDVLDAFDSSKESFNSWIEAWKNTLLNVITNEVIRQVQPNSVRESLAGFANTANAVLSFIREKIDKIVAGGSVAIQKDAIERFKHSNFIRIYIDDLDRGWEARRDDIKRISALLNAIRDVCGSSNALQFRVGLRSDVYYLVRTSDESTDKIEDKIVWLTWKSHDLLVLFAKRVETFFGNQVNESQLRTKRQDQIAKSLHRIMDPIFKGQGKWTDAPVHRVLLSLQRKRPRDLVKLLGGAAKNAYMNENTMITTNDLRETFASYSAERLQDIINEFGTEVTPIDRLLLAMKPTKAEKRAADSYTFSQDALDKKIGDVLQQINVKFANGTQATPRSVGQFLYKIDFIVARRLADDGTITRRFYDQSRFLFDQYLDFGFSWEIHPAYRWALQPDTLESVFEQIELGTDP